MINYVPIIIAFAMYILYGVFVYRALFKLVLLSNNFEGEACDSIEKVQVKVFTVLFWPVVIIFIGD